MMFDIEKNALRFCTWDNTDFATREWLPKIESLVSRFTQISSCYTIVEIRLGTPLAEAIKAGDIKDISYT